MDNKRISELVDEEMIKQDANRYRDMRKILTIPKSIAERLINFIEINHGTDFIIEELLDFKNMERSHCFEPDLKLHDFLQNNTNICVLYLAGKALGVDLVKVGEG
ncbi:hypothetical protein [Lactococcus lactis]|uniref:hypothetical protein n=1 Tax=Lactococcus lactis TaxID=1358 RepID=UPI003850DFF8